MATIHPTNRHGVRPQYIELGTDTTGATHTYRTADDTVIAVTADGTRELQGQLPAGHNVDDYVDHVAATRGWDVQRYGVSLVDALAASLEVA